MSSMVNKQLLEDLYQLLMFKCFTIEIMPLSKERQASIMTFEKVDNCVEAVYYCQENERIEVTSMGEEVVKITAYLAADIPEEYKGVYHRLKTSFPYRKTLQPLRELMGLSSSTNTQH